jgi:zinc D-Ala-D-Ala carboxypeptidase
MSRRPGDFFTFAEFRADTAPDAVKSALTLLCWHVLDPLRRGLGRPVTPTSGWRRPSGNAAVGGSQTSQHLTGEAADVVVEGMNARELARAVMQHAETWDQLIWYPDEGTPGWVHVSYESDPAKKQRREVRRASPKRPDGSRTYRIEQP